MFVGSAAAAYAMKHGDVLIDFTVVANLYADFANRASQNLPFEGCL